MNILFVTSTYVGDSIVSTGLLGHLIDRHPEARITIVCGRPSAPLFEAVPNLARTIVFTKRKAHLHWIGLWRQCAGQYWDIVVDLRGSAMAYLLRAGRRHVFRPKATEIDLRAAEWADVLGLDHLPRPRLWTSPAHDARAAALVPAGGPVIVVGPTANWPAKIWPADRFAALVGRLAAPGAVLAGARVAVLGAAGDEPAARPVLHAVPENRRIDLVGRTDLLTAGAVLRRSSLYVGNDSGLLYLSVAADIPAVGLFGPTPGRFGRPVGDFAAPWAKKTAVVRAAVPMEALLAQAAAEGEAAGSLMGSLTVDAAEDAAIRLLRRCAAATA